MTPRRSCLILLGLALILIGADGSDHPLVDAAKNGDRVALQTLLNEGADVNAQAADGSTALLWASYRDDLESAELLIRAGADVNIANDLGATPIWAASRNGSAAMADELLAAGADPDAPLLLGETPLVTASRSGNPKVVRMLLEKGADVNARGARGQTPLMFSAAQRHPDVVRVLLEHGADVHAVSDSWSQLMAQSPHSHPEHQAWVQHGGNTALMFAARVGDLESAKRLVAAGADVDAPSAWGSTPLAIATYAHFGEQFLIREQTTRQLVYFDRDQILPGQFGEFVEFLLERGADPNAGAHRFHPADRRGPASEREDSGAPPCPRRGSRSPARGFHAAPTRIDHRFLSSQVMGGSHSTLACCSFQHPSNCAPPAGARSRSVVRASRRVLRWGSGRRSVSTTGGDYHDSDGSGQDGYGSVTKIV